MRKGQYTREQAIAMVGIATIDELDEINSEPTSRCQCDGDDSVEFSASISASMILDGCNISCEVTAFYYQDPEALQNCDDLGNLDWEINGYDIM